jgi:hypothetical protein
MYKSSVSSHGPSIALPGVRGGAPSKAGVEASSWYGKLAGAWGAALDRQADRTVALAQKLDAGTDGPGQALQVSAAAQQLTFLCTAASNVSSSIGQALETLGRKQ